jgi:hypothetical protein
MRKLIATTILSLLAVFYLHAQTTNYQVYALYVVNIAKYSSWPNVNGELKIAVFGKSKAFDELFKQNGKMVNGHTLKVLQVEDIANLGETHILYVSEGKSNAMEEVVKQTDGKSVMIVAEREGMFRKGAGFSFVIIENNTLKFDINATELEKRQIKVSKSLTTLAHESI